MNSGWEVILPYLTPVTQLVADPEISEIMVNPSGAVFIERAGQMEPTDIVFEAAMLEAAVIRIARDLGADISDKMPLLETRLPDGSRIAAVMPPCSVGGIALNIRKFQRRFFSTGELLRRGSLSDSHLVKLTDAIETRQNILISGGTGAGKTTLLNALAHLIPAHARIVLIEDVSEIQIEHPNIVRLEGRRELPGMPAVTIAHLLRMALRLRPDRIIVGEVRGAEAFDLIQALNSGHQGSLSTIHADSAAKAVERLAGCILQAVPAMDPAYIKRHWIEPSIQVFVHMERQADGSRRVQQIIRNAVGD